MIRQVSNQPIGNAPSYSASLQPITALATRLPLRTQLRTQHVYLLVFFVSVFAALKAAYRDEVERLERGGVNAIGKEHFTSLYSRARSKVFT